MRVDPTRGAAGHRRRGQGRLDPVGSMRGEGGRVAQVESVRKREGRGKEGGVGVRVGLMLHEAI